MLTVYVVCVSVSVCVRVCVGGGNKWAWACAWQQTVAVERTLSLH